MKRNTIIISAALVTGMLLWNCTDREGSGSGTTLEESLNRSSEKLDNAIGEIAATPGYRVLSLGENGSLKSTAADSVEYLDSITLGEINGVYEYQNPDTLMYCHNCFYNLFKKTGESDLLIVSLPESKVFHPYMLHYKMQSDTTLVNNFTITASDYHYYFARGLVYDYKLLAGFELDNTNIGNLDLASTSTSFNDFTYHSAFAFNDDYSIRLDQIAGDTSTYSFALLNGTETLLSESVNTIKTGTSKHHERSYQLIIGNVEILKTSESDSIQIFLNGVLQQNAMVEFIDISKDNGEGRAICRRNRDIQITFDDGSVTMLSELIGPSLETLSNLAGSLQNMYFASYVVDYIAWNIYSGRIS